MLPSFNGFGDFGSAFQLRILSFLMRHPEKATGIIKPQYFNNLHHFDIARVICEAYEAQPKSRLTKPTLKQLVKQSLDRKELRNWSYYKKAISAICRIDATDTDIIFQQALEFARQQEYRQALIKAEKAVTEHRYEAVHKLP
jgi:hypothetical protein